MVPHRPAISYVRDSKPHHASFHANAPSTYGSEIKSSGGRKKAGVKKILGNQPESAGVETRPGDTHIFSSRLLSFLSHPCQPSPPSFAERPPKDDSIGRPFHVIWAEH